MSGLLADEAKAACHTVLTGLGLRKRAGTTYTVEVTKEVLGFVGLNVAVNRPTGPFTVNPVVGARHQELERVVAELTGVKPSPYVPPTVSSPLGYLMPDRRFVEWEFDDAGSVDATAAALGAALAEHGLPFVRAHAELEPIATALASGDFGVPQQNAVRLPVALALLGSVDEARRTLSDELAALGDRSDAAAQWFRSFASAFEQRFPGG